MRITIADKAVLEVALSREELLDLPEVQEIVEGHRAVERKLGEKITELQTTLSRYERLSDFETKSKVAGKRLNGSVWEKFDGYRWVPDIPEAA